MGNMTAFLQAGFTVSEVEALLSFVRDFVNPYPIIPSNLYVDNLYALSYVAAGISADDVVSGEGGIISAFAASSDGSNQGNALVRKVTNEDAADWYSALIFDSVSQNTLYIVGRTDADSTYVVTADPLGLTADSDSINNSDAFSNGIRAVPANKLKPGSRIDFYAAAKIDGTGAGQSIDVFVWFAGTPVSIASIPSVNGDEQIILTGSVYVRDYSHFMYSYRVTVNGTVIAEGFSNTPATFDTTDTNSMVVVATWDGANVSNDIKLKIFELTHYGC